MSPLQILLEALRSLRANRLRSALTMLGVVIGIASVLLMLAIGDAVKRVVDQELSVLGRNNLIIQPGEQTGEGGVRQRGEASSALTVDDARALGELPSVKAAAPVLQGSFQVQFGEGNGHHTVLGSTPALLELRSWQMAEGIAFDDRDVAAANRVALIGAGLAREHFGRDEVVGKGLRIKGQPFTVIGVLAGSGRTLDGIELGELVLVPISALPLRLSSPGRVHYISLQAENGGALVDAREDVAELLRDRHRLAGDRPDDFTVTDLATIAETGQAIAAGLSLGLGLIGAVSLVVGGIGIMNIMLVNVSERTREIGIRMAIGARPRDVLSQFLGEAVLLCLIGAGVGWLLALAIAAGVSAAGAVEMHLAWSQVAVAVGFASLVGLFFGYYPARRASRLLPIECLRHE